MITCFIILHYTFSLWSKIHEETYVLLKQIMYNGMIQIWDWCAALLPKEIHLVSGCFAPMFLFRPGVVRAATFRSQQMCFISIQIWCQKAREILKLSIKIFSNSFKGFFITILWKIMIYNETWNMVKIYLNNLFKKIKSLELLYLFFLKIFKWHKMQRYDWT